jgi:transcriptional regulator with XRE-family HTH domain
VSKTTRFSRRTFGEAIRQEREKLGLSQEAFAELARSALLDTAASVVNTERGKI